ncbi:MAG: nucleoside-diphosphate-sugar epimerase [Polaribacter sp.]|jgi:nucleoside-diphosphate-sugar epimerase
MQLFISGASGFVGGTAAVLRAAQEAEVSRFVHMATEAAIVHGQYINGASRRRARRGLLYP